MKKYMVATGIELLKEFNIHHVALVINSRCHRFICSECNTVSEGTHCVNGCKGTDEQQKFNKYFNTSYNELYHDNANIHVGDIDGRLSVYYWQLDCYVNQATGELAFTKAPMTIFEIDGDTFKAINNRNLHSVALEPVLEAIKKAGISCKSLEHYINISKILGFKNCASMNQFISFVEAGNSLLSDEEFVKTHVKLVTRACNHSYSSIKITDTDSMCDFFEVPKCLSEYLADDYFDSLTGYADIRALDAHPVEIQGCFAYYIASGKFKKQTIKAYLNTFDPDFFNSRDKIRCFISYVRKNLWMGENVFTSAFNAFKYAMQKNLPITETYINSKFYIGMNNVDELSRRFGDAISNEFYQMKETTGIVPALKQLISWVKEQETEAE